ncbi:LiaF transmembrane domain-containing protein [Halopiger aswanensis]|uniref:Putative membrane protein n=1 Tax=Halopiger aswanensis TaxID=148449 RepID=A0A3R7DZ24_9EURY|nr:LiaF domain-containing protein [Halopiger aswanensis]RKD94932.1 putative membrane protein [Halopiger aswanensis]
MSTTISPRRLTTSQFLFGLVVVVVGVLLLLETTGIAPVGSLLLYVPSLFVAIGAWALVRSRLRNIVGPIVLICVAGAWQVVALGYATVEQVVVFWPVLVIAFGVSIIAGQFRSRVRATDDAVTSAFAAFGGVEKRNTSRAFAEADLTAVFGGTELDLRDAAIESRPARINAVALFGGVDIIVPREWNVQLDVLPVLGGASDDRPRREVHNEEVDLVVTGFAAFGGVSITD